ncbi:hypothetical protein HN748_04895 [Candidatus Peregrinibacteria bacterium]|jgi:hypothetical protein|nr:hypothetical protein [Candidatus Peregrinibacteria bacterium]MBT7484540.1 hypothetical protein [Candidatus Peregrinibacteria bacterium]MBT7703547.1 hypothetical protein [Candidatus Peregrinibacteria bacterium]
MFDLNREPIQRPTPRPVVSPRAIATMLLASCLDTGCRVQEVLDDTNRTVECSNTVPGDYGWQFGGTTPDDAIYNDPEDLRNVTDAVGVNRVIISSDEVYVKWLAGNVYEASLDPDTGDTGDTGLELDSGLKFTPQLTKREDCADDDDSFSYELWEDKMQVYSLEENEDLNLALQDFINGEVLEGVMLLDDLGLFEDEGPDSPTLDDMAKETKRVLEIPDGAYFPLIVRHDAPDLLVKHPEGYEFEHLTHVYVQISEIKSVDGLEAFINDQIEAAEKLGLDIIWGVNLLDWELAENYGGVCPSGHDGFREGRCVITTEELLELVSILKAKSSGCSVGGWRYNRGNSYLYEDAKYASALQSLAEVASN